MKLDVTKLWTAIENKRWEDRLVSYRQISRMLGLSYHLFTRISQGHPPNADALITILVWLDLPARDFVTEVST